MLLAPVRRPGAFRDFMAFEHVATARARRGLPMDPDWYQLPVFYFTNPHVILGPDEELTKPATEQLDFVGTGCILELSAVHGGDRFPWLAPRDVVELEVEGIGVLRNVIGPSSA